MKRDNLRRGQAVLMPCFPNRSCNRLAFAWVVVLGVLFIPSVSVADSLTRTSGEVHQGRVLHYDEFSYVVLLEGGGKVVVPREDVERVEKSRKRRPRYSKRAELILSVEQITQVESPERLVVARLKDPGEQGKEYGLNVEAQTLLYVVESQDQYGDAYRTLYEWGGTKYELEYEWEKGLLLRRHRVAGRGLNVKVLGPRGEGLETLRQAAKGRIREEKSLLSRMYDPNRKPLKGGRRAVPRQPSAW